jgi:peptide/nickel transport system substrate-binding protein
MGKNLSKVSAAILFMFLLAVAISACGTSTSTNSTATTTSSSSSASESSSGSGSGEIEPAATSQKGGELIWAKAAEVTALDPIAGGYTSIELQTLVYETLIQVNGTELEPALAESWEQTAPDQYVLTLRKGATFSNGRPMTDADVIGSLERATSPKSIVWGGIPGIKKVVADGEGKVKVTTEGPRTSFLASLGHIAMAILPMKELHEGTFDPEKEMIGTGPFMVAGHKKDTSWTLVPNPYYWNKELPRVDKLTVRIMPEEAARIAGLRTGSVDVTEFKNPDSLQLLEGIPNVETYSQKTTSFYRLDVNVKNSVFSNKKMREALSLAINRQEIAEIALAGQSEPTAAITPTFGSLCNQEEMPYAHQDVNRAKELVKEAGEEGKTIVINTFNTIVPLSKPIGEVLQKQLEAIGLKVELESLEAGEATERIFGGEEITPEFDLSVGESSDEPDPALGLRNWNPEGVGWNAAYLVPNKEINRLVAAINTIPEGQKRDADIKKICTEVALDANMLALDTTENVIAWRSDVVEPKIQEVESYTIPLRYLASFAVKQGS